MNKFLSSDITYIVLALIIATVVFVLERRKIKRPLLVVFFLMAFVALYVTGEIFQDIWVTVLNSFLLLILVLTFICLGDNGVLGFNDNNKSIKKNKWKDKHPKFAEFLEKNPRLPFAILYGSICAFFVRGISLTVLYNHRTAWESVLARGMFGNEQIIDNFIRVEGMVSIEKGLLHIFIVWIVVTMIIAFISSLFVRDKTNVGLGAAFMLVFCAFMAPMPLTILERLCLGIVCALCAYISIRLYYWNISERVCRLFKLEKSVDPV